MSQSETVIDTPTYISEALRQVGGLKLNDGNVVPLVTMILTTAHVVQAVLN